MSGNVITELRDLVPLRALTPTEAYRLAELQADRFLRRLGFSTAPVPIASIAGLPKVHVRYVAHWPASGTTKWTHATWTVVINSSEPTVRQRFSLAHEFKHILDDRFLDVIYPKHGRMGESRLQESVCDYFAGCLLVPKVWLRRAWTSGEQSPFLLARKFNVSEAAIQVRLSQLGLTERLGRHAGAEHRSYFRLGQAATGAWEVA